MPDRDWYTAHVPKHWRRAARAIEGGADFDRIGDLALSAFPRAIRDAAGVAGFDEMLAVVLRFAAGRTIDAAGELRDALQAGLRAGGWELTMAAYAAAQATLADLAAQGPPVEGAAQSFAHRFVVQTLDASLFAPALLLTVGGRFASAEAAQDWQRGCLAAIGDRIDKLAASFLKHRSGVGLRAPRRATPRLKTADLLFQPVGS